MHRIIALLVVLFILSSGCSDKFKTKEELLKEGVRLMNANKPGAIIYFKNALEKDPNFFEARFQLAREYYRVGKFDSAEDEFKKLIKQNPSFMKGHIGLARVYLRESRPDEALKEISTYRSAPSPDTDVLEVTGWAYALKGDYATSAETLRSALSSDPSRSSAAVLLAKVLMKTGQTGEAKSQVSGILKREPANREALYLMAEIQATGKDYDAAIDDLDNILKTNPSDTEASFRKGVLYVEKGRYDDAVSLADGLIKAFPHRPEGFRLKGIALFEKKDLAGAVVALQKALSMRPSIGAYYLLGLCHFYRNEREQAMAQFQNALRMAPSFAPARVLTALLLMRDNRTDDVIDEIKKVVATDEENALAHNILGSAYLTKGLYQEGLAELNKALAIDPKLADIHIKKGFYEMGKGKVKEAETELRAAVRIRPDMTYTRALLASYYIKQREYGDAIKTLNEGISGQKGDAVLYNLIAETLLRQNKSAEAVEYLRKAEKADPQYDASYLNAAALFVQKGEAERGLQELKSFIGRAPRSTRALLALASLLETSGDKGGALKYYQAAKETGRVEGVLELAKFYMRGKEPDKALKVVDESIKKNPSDIVPYELRGEILFDQKRFEDARKTFEDLARINPDLALGYLTRTYIAMKRPDRALDRIRRELEKSPGKLELMAEISRLDQMMGKKQEAIENARQIIRRDPKSPIGYMALAVVYQQNKETDTALRTLREASRIKDVNLLMLMGNLYLSKKDYSAALDSYAKAEELRPGYVPAIFGRGTVYMTSGRRKEAVSEYSRALTFSQNHVPTLNNLAYIYAEESKNLPMALQLATRAGNLEPGNGLVQDTLGFVLLKNGRFSDAARALQKAAGLAPDNPSVYFHLALVYNEQGDTREAIANLQKALGSGDFAEKKEAKVLLEKLQKRGRS